MFSLLFPDLRTIEVNGSTVVMRFEGGIGVPMERVVHLDQDAHPVGVSPSLIDVLHRVLWLMEKRPNQLAEFLHRRQVSRCRYSGNNR